ALHRGRRSGGNRAHRRSPGGNRGAISDADCGRMRWHRHALFLRHHGQAERHSAAAARAAGLAAIAAVRLPGEALAIPRRHDLSLSGTALSFRTAIIMESFDPERYIQLIEQWGVTHSQLVPTMFSRMLKLPEDVRRRYDTS